MVQGSVVRLLVFTGAVSFAALAQGAPPGDRDGAPPPAPRDPGGAANGAPGGRAAGPSVPQAPPRPPGRRRGGHAGSASLDGPGGPGTTPRPPRLLPPDPSPGSAPQPAFVHLERHSVGTRIVDGVAVTEIEQTFHNQGDRIGEGTWTCPLPDGSAVTGFSIFVNGAEHPGRYLRREEGRRIYDEIVHRKRDPGLVELAADGSVVVRIFPIPPKGDMRVRMTYAHPVPFSNATCRLVTALDGITARGDPPLASLMVAVDIESAWPLVSVTTPALPLAARSPAHGVRWSGAAERQDWRPSQDLEVTCVLDTRSPRAAFHVATGADGERYFLGVVHAGDEWLHDVAFDLGESAADLLPARVADVAPRAHVNVLGRLTGPLPADLRLRATAKSGEIALTVRPEEGEGTSVGALWALRRIDGMCGSNAPTAENTAAIVDLAAKLHVLTPWNAILAEE